MRKQSGRSSGPKTSAQNPRRRVESDIIHETTHYWVTKERFKGRDVCYVWRFAASGTHGVLAGTFDLGERSAQRAIEDCNRREAAL
jgi:hypothetical protein